MPKKQGPVKKECESCDQQIPVACKTCPECSHELIPEKDRKEDTTVEVAEIEMNADLGERRRSVRAKRDKPDYYDALDYESKRQKTPRGEKKKVGGPTSTRNSTAAASTAKMRRFPGTPQNQGRATLAWRKEEDGVKRKVKKGSGGGGGKKEEAEEVGEPVLEDIPTDKVFPCAVSLAEINRKLGVVMWKPVQTK